MNHVKIFKGWPLQDAPSKLVQLWYKSFPPGRFLPRGNEEANYVEYFGLFSENKILGTGF